MRTLGLICAFAFMAGCGDDNGAGGVDLAVEMDLSAAGDDLAGGGGGDLANVPDGGMISADAGVAGATCTTACDCMPGLGCFGSKCTAGVATVYCCNSAVCPANSLCQSNAGAYNRCGGSTGMVDLASFDVCPHIHCTSAAMQQCTTAGCTQCVAGSTGMVCAK